MACVEVAVDAPATSSTPATVPTYEGPGELRSVQAGTQMHLRGVAIGVGNIWEEDYVTAAGESRTGLTAGLFITVQADPGQNRFVRVHPGQDVAVPGYLLRTLAVESRVVHLAVIED
jgi:hypothetical protein